MVNEYNFKHPAFKCGHGIGYLNFSLQVLNPKQRLNYYLLNLEYSQISKFVAAARYSSPKFLVIEIIVVKDTA